MLQNPTANFNVQRNSFAEIWFKQLYLSNHSELLTCTYELSFPTTTNTVNSYNIKLPASSPCTYVRCKEIA